MRNNRRTPGRLGPDTPVRIVATEAGYRHGAMPRALLVTDSTWVVNDVSAALSLGEWEIDQLDDPQDAVARVEETSPDAVIVDMQVTSMGGMAVIRDIRSHIEEDSRPRTVLLLDRQADRFLAGRAGADASVIKPFEAVELRSALA